MHNATLFRVVLVLVIAASGSLDARDLQAPPVPPPQTPVPAPLAEPSTPSAVAPERVTFDDAVKRAMDRNPSVISAAADILRAEGLLKQARAATLLAVDVVGVNTTLDGARGLGGQTFTPQNTFSTSLPIGMPLFAPAAWARRVQAEDTKNVAAAGEVDVKRQIAVATAQAYLTVIAAHRVVESQVRARDTAQAFYKYAADRLQAGAGSRLTALQAQVTLSADEALVEQASLGLYRAQEALGVLVTDDRPIDAADEPAFEVPDEGSTLATVGQDIQQRTDIRLGNLQVSAARRVFTDSWKDWLPSVNGIFQPAFQTPGSIVSPQNSWRALIEFSTPVFDSGNRKGARMIREADLRQNKVVLDGQLRQANSEIRTAFESVRRTARVLASARAAADQANQVLEITAFTFKAGAATNLDVIDAQRRSRDADTAVAVAEDNARQSRLDLLSALGRFPK